MNNLPTWLKPVAAYGVTAVGSWVASRYHLSPDQLSAMAADAATLAAAIYGVRAHMIAVKNGGGK